MVDASIKSLVCFKDSPLELEGGATLGPIQLAYQTHGALNDEKDNVVLVCHPLTGNAHVAGLSDPNDPKSTGWWDQLIGPGKAINTDTHFVICINSLGSCKGSTGPCEINPATNKPYDLDFPVITIGDMVRAQKAVIDHLGITQIKMVIGGSMGGMQALEWVCMYPDMIRSCVPIAATGQVSPQTIAFDAVGRQAIRGDKDFYDGHYSDHNTTPHHGLALARMIGHITYLSESSMDQKFGRKLQEKNDLSYCMDQDFQIESYLQYQGDKFVNRFDANSYLYLTKAVSYFDLPRKYGSLEKAFSPSDARFLVVSISSDWLYTPEQSKVVARQLMRLNKEVTYVDVDTHYGHDAFLIDNPDLFRLINVFLESL